jgi:lipoyl(octanoyl) transferase
MHMPAGAQRNPCRVVDLGEIVYGEAVVLQEQLVAARKAGAAPDVLLLCRHPHVLTLGRNGHVENLRVSPARLEEMGVAFHRASRGGDITYHGPGQIVAYPILNLAEIRRDVVWYVRRLEEAMIRATAAFGIEAFRVPGRTGVWVWPPASSTASVPPAEEKLGAIGVHISRWVTSHGLAYNLTTDLRYFDLIVPCGIADRRPTSLAELLGRPVTPDTFVPFLVAGFGDVLGLEMASARSEELAEWLAATSPAHFAGVGSGSADSR